MELKATFFGVALALVSSAPATAFAQAYPAKAVTAVPAFPPGAPNDFIMRLVGEQFKADMNQVLIVENRPGAGGNIAAEFVAHSAADGYTLLATVDTVVTANPFLYKTANLHGGADLTPVIYLANTAQTLVCHPSVPARTMAEFIEYARPRTLAFASGGYGVPGHLAAELFMASTGIKMTHVPYKGPGPATQDVLAGMVPCGFLATPVVMPHVKSGKLVALAVTSAKRSPIASEIPTMAEAGVSGAEAAFGELLLAPTGTPMATINALNTELAKLLQQADVREHMLAVDLEFVPNTPAQASARLERERAKWKEVIARLGLRVQ